MDSTTQPIVAGFMALRDKSSRRAVFNEIIDHLTSHEIREMKSRFEMMTFQCDLLDKLPLELVAMLVEYLELADLILLRRVSKRWCGLLSSTKVITAAISYHMGKSVIKPDFTLADFNALIQKRLRAERGMPAVVATIPYGLSSNIHDELNRDGISYCNGVCVWIEESTDRTTIFMVHLPTGKNRTLTTANREEFTHVQVSDTLISATSVRGYCHVWNMPKEEYKSFRIPSLQFAHYISIGSKVMLSYADSVIHFCFDSGVARSIKIRPFILLLSAHAEDDGFSVVCVRRKDGNDFQQQKDGLSAPRSNIKGFLSDMTNYGGFNANQKILHHHTERAYAPVKALLCWDIARLNLIGLVIIWMIFLCELGLNMVHFLFHSRQMIGLPCISALQG
ncbi:hypothetical protein PITC_065400 [Penicillium italicum]|uniref:F-box domain-containing protein n=1 Tax=Penicillium italicum TaxID=40296 RepID=A0A0A2KVF8_PENIT|nr:hypothetical protein PITC_065400 [Penicillium italicum]